MADIGKDGPKGKDDVLNVLKATTKAMDMACEKAKGCDKIYPHAHFFGFDLHFGPPEGHAHDGLHDADAAGKLFQVFGLVRGAEHVIGRAHV